MICVDRRAELLDRIVVVPSIFGGKPVIRGRRLAVEHVLAMLAAGDEEETILNGYRWLEPDDIRACLIFAQLMDREEDWERDREWGQEVEPDENEIVFGADASEEPYQEWREFAEPDYDAEEEMRTMASSLSPLR